MSSVKIEKAIKLANEEINEFESAFSQFMDKVKHLETAKSLINPRLMVQVLILTEEAKHIMNSTVQKEELLDMPEELFDQVLENQMKRAKILERIVEENFETNTL